MKRNFNFGGNISITIELPYLGFVAGQIVKFKLFIENQSFNSLEKVKINFKRIVRLSSDNFDICNYDETKLYENTITNLHQTHRESFELPRDLISTDTKYCSIIKTFYELKIVVVIAGPHENLEAKIPIFIGTIEFNDEKVLTKHEINFTSLQPFTSESNSKFLNHKKFFMIVILFFLSIIYIYLISKFNQSN